MPKQRPNVLLFLTDDQRFDTLRALGNEAIQTPNLDALLARGTCFTRAHIPGGTCPAVCMPSRAMLHSGRSLFHLDREGQDIPVTHTTMAECFRAAGYTTFGTGKWHNGKSAFARGFSRGDEIFFGGMGDHWNVPAYHFDPSGRYETRCPVVNEPMTSKHVEFRECDHIHAGIHSTDLFTDSAIHFLDERDGDQPFFMYVSLMAPHDPRTMPKRFLDMYPPNAIRLPANVVPEHAIDTGALRIRDELLAAFPRHPDAIKRHLADYYAMITHLDEAFGRLMKSLQDHQLIDNTLIAFAGDNGLAVGQHGLMGKQNLYEHSIRVPLILAGPGVPAGERRDHLVYLLDLFPTLCDLTGLDTPPSVEGTSLKTYLDQLTTTGRENLFLAYEKSIRGVTDGRWKLIEYACGATQLFDLIHDPEETCNLADTPASRETITRMRHSLRTWATQWDDLAHPAGNAFWTARRDLCVTSP